MTEKYVTIGHTKKVHGVQGEIKAYVQDNHFENLFQSKVIFIHLHGKPVPFFIENIRENNGIILKLEGVDSPQKATEISSKEISMREQDLLIKNGSHEPNELYFSKFKGFYLHDLQLGLVGKIMEIVEFPHQEMALVHTDFAGKQVMIPLHPNLIEKVDLEKETILMNLPKGILEL